MRTYREIEAKIAATQERIDERINRMNYRMVQKMRGIHAHEGIAALKEQFKNDIKITKYGWTHEYSFLPNRRCFTNEKLIFPGTKAYKGIYDHRKSSITTMSGFYLDVNIYPEEIWLTKGEFIMRKLKGQI